MAEAKKTPEKEYDPWTDMVPITLPRAPKGENNCQFVGVNGRTFQVPRTGKPVEVPRPVYEVLLRSAEMADYAADRKGEMELEQPK